MTCVSCFDISGLVISWSHYYEDMARSSTYLRGQKYGTLLAARMTFYGSNDYRPLLSASRIVLIDVNISKRRA